MLSLLGLLCAAPQRGEDAVRPVVGGDVQPAKHLVDAVEVLNPDGVDGRLQRGVAGLVQGDAGEEVVDEAHEEGLVLVHQLGDVHVAQHPHHDGALAVRGAGVLHRPQCAQHRQDVAQTKVVVDLRGGRGRA